MTSPRKPKRRRLGPLLGNWDLIGAALLAGVFVVTVLNSARPLEAAGPYLAGSIPFGVAIAAAATVAGRWVSDRAKDSAYGELLRVVDPQEIGVQRPAHVVAWTGIVTSLVGAVLVLTLGEFGRTLTTVFYGVMVFLVSYALLGLADVLRQNRRHLARMSAMQTLREGEDRRRRTGGGS